MSGGWFGVNVGVSVDYVKDGQGDRDLQVTISGGAGAPGVNAAVGFTGTNSNSSEI